MLDPRLYRAAFAPLLLALVVAAFSLTELPRPLRAPLAPDAFDGPGAYLALGRLAAQYPDRTPGGRDDGRLAAYVASALRASFCPRTGDTGRCSAVTERTVRARTVAGERVLRTVVATRLGQPGPGIVVVAHRDAAAPGAQAELSGTAALLELARVFAGRRTRRTLTLVSTSGGSGGAAGARQLAGALPDGDPHPDAVLVLGDLASAARVRPWELVWSRGAALAPPLLRRTAQLALRAELGVDPGAPGVLEQAARLAFPFALGEEGPFNAAGVPAVAFQASGERGPSPAAAVSAQRLRGFGRAALRTIDALDAGPDLRVAPTADLVVAGKLMPGWVVRLLAGLALLPAVLGAVDGLARARRRRAAIAPQLRDLIALTLPFAATLFAARALGPTGLLDRAPGGPVAAGRVPVDAAALALVAVVFALGWLAVPAARRLLAAARAPDEIGAAAALAVTVTALAAGVWVFNPYAALVLALPAHLWLLAAAPEVRLRRGAALALVLVALAPAGLVLGAFAAAVGASPPALPWSLLLLVAGGQVGPATLLVAAVLGACAVAAVRLALAAPGAAGSRAPRSSVSGPLGHTGPGSLGGTESGFGTRR